MAVPDMLMAGTGITLLLFVWNVWITVSPKLYPQGIYRHSRSTISTFAIAWLTLILYVKILRRMCILGLLLRITGVLVDVSQFNAALFVV